MAHLGQLIAIEQGERERATEAKQEVLRDLGEAKLLTGIEKRYRVRDEGDTEVLPDESHKVQVTVDAALRTIQRRYTRLWNLAATKEDTNTRARGDIVVDDMTIMEDVPVTFMLFLERELGYLRDLVRQLPVLDPAVDWTGNGDGVYATAPVETIRTKKVPRSFVLQEVTQYHPAQVQPYQEDVLAGYWMTRKFSGALPRAEQRRILDNIDALGRAVRFARERANKTEVVDKDFGEQALSFVFEFGE